MTARRSYDALRGLFHRPREGSLPDCVISPDGPRGMMADVFLAIDERSFFIVGWVRDTEAEITKFAVVSPQGERVELLPTLFRYPRTDVEKFYGASSDSHLRGKTGCMGFFQLRTPVHQPDGWKLEMWNGNGVGVQFRIASPLVDPVKVRSTILEHLASVGDPTGTLVLHHIFPALRALEDRLAPPAEVETLLVYGTPPPSPSVSIIVPVFARIDFLEHQLAQFVHDRDIRASDLLYVLDSPELASSLTETAAQLFRLYNLPFRIAVLTRHSGFAAATNLGVSLSRGSVVLLLNSDVLPDKPGWLSTMEGFLHRTPRIGALSPKLLYEDDNLQHAGMYFSRPPGSVTWEALSYFKGLNRHLPAANVTRPVPAVTGACLMVERRLYEQVGGLSRSYLQGDYADSELCLRLVEAGYENWYLPDVELYHFEGQSSPLRSRHLTFRYDAWLHTHLWGGPIARIMAHYGEGPLGGSNGSPRALRSENGG